MANPLACGGHGKHAKNLWFASAAVFRILPRQPEPQWLQEPQNHMADDFPQTDPTILKYYEEAPEEIRLERGPGLLEAARTRELLGRFAPRPPAVVIDVGGAGGSYALWLAAFGFTVHLLDPVKRLVKEAARRSAVSRAQLASCQLGDARRLPFPDGFANMVLLLGPLYHLSTKEDRLCALQEAHRVLAPGGVLFASAISRWASLLDGLAGDLFLDPDFAQALEGDLRDGRHVNATGRPELFTTAYLHRPDELQTEIEEAAFESIGLFGLEGPGWLLADLHERLADERKREDLLRVARIVESEPAMMAASAHLLAVARRPDEQENSAAA